jgi:hypothetical protein
MAISGTLHNNVAITENRLRSISENEDALGHSQRGRSMPSRRLSLDKRPSALQLSLQPTAYCLLPQNGEVVKSPPRQIVVPPRGSIFEWGRWASPNGSAQPTAQNLFQT